MPTSTASRLHFSNRGTWSGRGSGGLGPLGRVIILSSATAFGLLLIPADAQRPDAMRSSAIILSSALLGIPAAEGLILGIKAALKVRNLLLIGIVYWLLADLVQGLYTIQATTDGIETAFLATGLFAVGLSIGGALRIGGLPAGIDRISRFELTDWQVLILAVCCFIAGVFYYVFIANFSIPLILNGLLYRGRFSAPWARGALGDWHSFVEQLTYFGYLLAPLTAVMYMRSRALINGKTLFCAALTACFLVFLAQGGGRTGIGAVLGSAILAGILLKRRPLRPLSVACILAAIFAVQVTMNIVLENRGSGFGDLRASEWTLTTVRVDDNFNRLAETADYVPAYFPYSGLKFIYFTLLRPIPRALWPGKPINQGFTVQEALTDTVGDPGASLTNSVIGEAYSGYGFTLVVVMGMVFGVVGRWWEQVLTDQPTAAGVILYSVGTMALFGALRGFVNIVLLSYPILSFLAVFRMFRFARLRLSSRRRCSL